MDPETTQAEQVQPPETDAGGQGQNGIEGLYDLSSAPEELRPHLEQELKKVEANVTRRFQEHADYRKRFEALEGIEGLTDVDPADLSELLAFHQIASDPGKFEEWWAQIGRQLEFLDDGDDPDGGEELGEPDQVSELRELVTALQSELSEFKESGAREQRVQDARAQLDSRLDEIDDKHEGDLDRDLVIRLAKDYSDDEDPIGKGYEDYLRIKGGAQTELIEDRLGQPAGVNAGGTPNTSTEPITSFKDMRAAARQRLGVEA